MYYAMYNMCPVQVLMSGSKNYKNYREDITRKLQGIPEFSVKGTYLL